MYKVGIFGGSFNPPHNGHINIAVNSKKELMLDKMIIMPTGISPHKDKERTDFEHRLEMCKLAFRNQKDFDVSDLEGRTKGHNYTINTIRLLKKQYPPHTTFYLLIGADMLFYFESWYKYEAILKECTVVAAPRENGQYVDMIEYATEVGKIRVLNLPVKRVSSSEIREKLTNHEDISEALPPKVFDYIKEHGLYV